MQNILVIGLGNKARHGKDWIARRLRKAIIRQTEADCLTLTFGADLKAVCRVLLGMEAKNGVLLQKFGTDVMREQVDSDRWVRCLTSQINDLAADYKDEKCVVLIPDMRFPNEMTAIKASGGVTVQVLRVEADGSIYLPSDGRDPKHPSEIALDGADFDYRIRAVSGDFDALNAGVDRLLNIVIRWLEGDQVHRPIGFTSSLGPVGAVGPSCNVGMQ